MRDERRSKRQLIDDLEDQRQRVAELEESVARDREVERQLQHLLDSLTDGVGVVDLNGTYTLVNQTLVEMYRFGSKDEMLGSSALAFFAPEELDRAIAHMDTALRQGRNRYRYYASATTDQALIAS